MHLVFASLTGIFGGLLVGMLVFYLAVAGVCHASVQRFAQPFAPARSAQRLRPNSARAITWSIYNIFGNAALVAPIHYAIGHHQSRVYFSIADYGWGYLVLSTMGCLAFAELTIYWIHRGLHTRFLYRHIHRHHHAFRVSNSWVSFAFHPIDAFLQSLPYHAFALLIPIHDTAYLLLLGLTSVWTIAIHDRVELVSWAWLNGTSHHTVHHYLQRFNYGQYLTVCDRWFGTHRLPTTLHALGAGGGAEAASSTAPGPGPARPDNSPPIATSAGEWRYSEDP